MRSLLAIAVVLFLVASGVVASQQANSCQVNQSTTEASPAPLFQQGRLQVGEYVRASIDSPHPYAGLSTTRAQLIYSREIYHPGATYIAPHFSRFELAEGSYVIVRSPDSSRSWRYEGYGKQEYGKKGNGGFWGIHISGEKALIELWAKGPAPAYGFSIDRYGRGFTAAEMGQDDSSPEAICTADDKENAICYETSESTIYDESRSVVRLLITGSSLCTGWLLGDEGHMMTNEHCITTQTDAANTDYEFMAEGATCATNCPQLGCDGTIEATSGTLIQDSAVLDYALVKLPGNLSSTYGFMQFRGTGAVLEERIYSPQHPSGRGKEIAVVSTYPANPSGFGEVDSLTETACSGGPSPDVGYFLDTEGGSSGSPVLAYSDNLVVSLHHCRGSASCNTGTSFDDPNRGVAVPLLITDLGANLPNNAIGSGEEIFADGFESGDTTAWSNSVP
ncbi:MAG: serine protease [Thermoanaerobaculia bacterium]